MKRSNEERIAVALERLALVLADPSMASRLERIGDGIERILAALPAPPAPPPGVPAPRSRKTKGGRQ
jgi:hypothetical protein